MSAAVRYAASELRRFAANLLNAAGMEADKAAVMANVLVEADLLGHSTHGLALLPRYLNEIAGGRMATSGEPHIVSDRGACVAWLGRNLPGLWLATRAIDLALERVRTYGTVSVAIGECHHLGGLAAYLPRVTEQGCLVFIATSGPGVATVAPYGGTRAVLAPDPVAAGIPTGGDPILVDISASITTNNMAGRLVREGRHYDHPWLMDAEGVASRDPSVLQRGGTILPAGGMDHGQKGYGWALLAEAFSQGLSGHGRADDVKGMYNAAFIQVIDPEAFAGLGAFTRQTSFLADACRASPPRPGAAPVRVPGGSAVKHKRDAVEHGLPLDPAILETLRAPAAKLAQEMPQALEAGE